MNFRKYRGLAAVTLAAALVLSGCGTSGDKDEPTTPPTSPESAPEGTDTADADAQILSAIELEGADANTAPTKVNFEAPLGIANASATFLSEGTGEAVEPGALMSVNFVQFDGSTGEQVFSTYEKKSPQVIIEGDQQIFPVLMDTFKTSKVGARIAFATPEVPQSETEQGQPSVLFIMELSGLISDQPDGEEVPHVEGNPSVTFTDEGAPELELPADFKVGSELQVIPLLKGDGDVVSELAQVTVNYTGWKASDGEKFDSSFDRNVPFQFSTAGGVIQGWMDGVKDQTVGSRVLLLIPKEMGYAGSAGHELEKEDLVFVVDILAVERASLLFSRPL